jgi:hypothetical protein
MNGRNVPLFGSLTVSWLGTAANFASEAKSILGALAALASLVASCYAIAAARKRLFNAEKPDKHKRRGAKTKRRNVGLMALMALTLFAGQGCTHVGGKMEKARVALENHEEVLKEESRALTTGVVDALALAPKSPETELAKSLAVADQQIEGLPLKRLPVTEALSGDTNAVIVIDERVKAIEALRVENARLTEQVRVTEEKLVAMGVKFEEERNARIRFWSKWLSTGTVLIGGAVALFVFCPVALPLVGRFLGWVVGKIPALAGAVGVVGKDAFDAVVRGVGNAREAMKKNGSADLAMLDTHLKFETDEGHKELIEQRRVALGV